MPDCPNCGAQADRGLRFCQNCGAVLPASGSQVGSVPHKSLGTTVLLAAVLGTLLMGFGHFYVGRLKRGLFALMAGTVTGIIFFVAILGGFFSDSFRIAALTGVVYGVLWIGQIIDARKLAQRYNEAVGEKGKPPW